MSDLEEGKTGEIKEGSQDLRLFSKAPLSIIDGVPSFVKEEYYYREVGRHKILNMISLARTMGWRRVTSETETVVGRYISDPIRTMFLELVRISPGERLLDLGAGWGSLSMQIAKRYPAVEVFALDKTLEGLLFLNIVKEQERLSNLHIARVDAADIPMEDSSIDVAIVIGVLEWAGESMKNLSPVEAQLRLLGEIKRLLRKGGRAVIGIENRYGYKYIRGKRDHSGVRYASVMPKSLTNAYMRARYGTVYRTYIYSEPGYRNLFIDQAGFRKVNTYVTAPNYRYPEAISDPTSIRKMMYASHKEKDRKWFRLLPDSLLRKIAPSYFFVLEK